MKKNILQLWLTLIFLLTTSQIKAEIISHEFNGTIYVEKATVTELEQLFSQNRYRRFRALENNAFPAIMVKTLPEDFAEIKSQKYRNELFIRILTPLALKINEELSNERNALLRLEKKFNTNNALTDDENKKLEELALKYDCFTRKQGTDRIINLFKQLKLRVDTIPPSIFVAAAAMESNWGSSRVALQANSLYKEKIWYTDEGLEPEENKEDGYRFKIFKSLLESMRSFAHTFNSDLAYRDVWTTRALTAKRHDTVIGESIAHSLSTSSNLPNFAGILNYTATFYDLLSLDIGHLQRIKK